MNQKKIDSKSASLIDHNIESRDDLKLKLLINNYKKGSKV